MALGEKKPQCVSNRVQVIERLACSTSDSLNGSHRIIIKHNKFFIYVCLSVCIYLFLHGLNRVSVVGKDEFKYWEELEVESEFVRAHKSSERQLPNSSVRREVTIV